METFLRRNFKVTGNISCIFKPNNIAFTKLIENIEVQLWHQGPMIKVYLGSGFTDTNGDFVVEFEVNSPVDYIVDGKISDVSMEAYYNGQRLDEPKVDLLKGLVAYWKLDESSGTTASDATGNGHEGALVGTTVPTWAAGKIDNGLQLHGGGGTTNSSISVNSGDDFNFGTGDFTIALWIKTDIVIGSGSDYSYIVDSGGGAENYFSIYFGNTDFIFESSVGVYAKPVTLTVDEWTHLTVRRTGLQLDCLINGVSLGKEALSVIISCPLPTFIFGNLMAGNYNFEGMFDEIGIWKGHGLSDEEVALLYNNGTGRQYPF